MYRDLLSLPLVSITSGHFIDYLTVRSHVFPLVKFHLFLNDPVTQPGIGTAADQIKISQTIHILLRFTNSLFLREMMLNRVPVLEFKTGKIFRRLLAAVQIINKVQEKMWSARSL